MIDGNRKIFERIWKLVLKVKTFLDENKTNNTINSSKKNNNRINISQESKAKPAVDIYKLRNSQLSMVNMIYMLFFQFIFC